MCVLQAEFMTHLERLAHRPHDTHGLGLERIDEGEGGEGGVDGGKRQRERERVVIQCSLSYCG